MKSCFNINLILVCIVLSVACLEGCYYDNEELLYGAGGSCDTIQAKFSTDVQQIISSKCSYTGCHSAGSGAGSTVLTDYAGISAKASRIKDRAVVQKSMPPSGTAVLSDAEIIKLKCWIESGALNN